MPVVGELRQITFVSGSHAWAMQDSTANLQPAAASQRQLDLWLTPHGFVKAAAMPGANPVMLARYEGGGAAPRSGASR